MLCQAPGRCLDGCQNPWISNISVTHIDISYICTYFCMYHLLWRTIFCQMCPHWTKRCTKSAIDTWQIYLRSKKGQMDTFFIKMTSATTWLCTFLLSLIQKNIYLQHEETLLIFTRSFWVFHYYRDLEKLKISRNIVI